MSVVNALIDAPRDVRAAALAVLDEVSGPMDARSLERMLQNEGLSRSQARRAMRAFRHVHVVALVPKCTSPAP